MCFMDRTASPHAVVALGLTRGAVKTLINGIPPTGGGGLSISDPPSDQTSCHVESEGVRELKQSSQLQLSSQYSQP